MLIRNCCETEREERDLDLEISSVIVVYWNTYCCDDSDAPGEKLKKERKVAGRLLDFVVKLSKFLVRLCLLLLLMSPSVWS